jgi:hypothetical protein
MKPPSRQGIGQGLAPIDSVISQEILCQFIDSNPLGTRPNEVAYGDFCESLLQKVFGFPLILSVCALPIGIAIPVILDPPN